MDYRALIFVPALVACVLFGFMFALFLANAYINVLQSTGSGSRHMIWVTEPLVDNFWKVFYLAWLIGLWVGPTWFLARGFAQADMAWLRYVAILLVLWLVYPVSQLSSLSATSVWMPLHHEVFGRLARKPHILLGFFALSGLNLILLGVAFHWTFTADGFSYLLLGSPLFVVACLVYSRLLGRLAFSLVYTRSILTRKKKKKKPAEEKPAENAVPPDAEPEFRQPSELPPIQSPDEGDLTGYDIAFEDAPKKRVRAESVDKPEPGPPPPRPKTIDDDDVEAYGVRAPEVEPEERAPVDVVKPSEMEMKLLDRSEAPKPPKQVWTPQLLQFLVQIDTLAVIGLLTVLCGIFGAVVRLAREFNPTRGATD